MSTGGGSQDGEDLWATVARAADDLYALRDTYFPSNPLDKISKLQTQSDLSLSLLDSIPIGAENQAKLVEESIQHAKNAISLDVKDGYSWYNLGNAFLTSFFMTGAWDHSKLLQALKAYQNAEKDEGMKSNPDLYFNSATVNKYLENYERALSGFEAAALKDPSLNATEEVQKMVNLLDKLENLLRGQARAKRLASMASSLAAVNWSVLMIVHHLHLYYLVCDSNQICFVLSVYGISNDAIKEGDQLTLLEPHYHFVDFAWKEKLLNHVMHKY
ncbi:hypothetical protein GH714_035911 [Hevea brasiliensis]|uniref:Tetratricopeptide repeat protein 5 OB fold domain-containing protein n=1 Tax=Hevea brasiliensis TaxID=3981 RepID=A0A6A6LUH1_HEVBR|nr:hypothetical protein GH714_035911 [Hevea brasiliensis]